VDRFDDATKLCLVFENRTQPTNVYIYRPLIAVKLFAPYAVQQCIA
jgi:hypothetical protein